MCRSFMNWRQSQVRIGMGSFKMSVKQVLTPMRKIGELLVAELLVLDRQVCGY